MGSMAAPRLFLVDTYGLIFRAFHARARSNAPPMRTSAGVPTEAVFIFTNMLRRMLTQYQPEYIAAVFEGGAPTVRLEQFADYKANRPETPPDLTRQVPYIERLLDALRIPRLEYEGFEADDVIGTIARRAAEAGLQVIIVSSDKDMLQLVTERVHMLNLMKEDTLYDPAKAQEFMGVPPNLVRDLLALKGDAVDNIPGAPGIGDKGARDLLLQFGSLDQLLERAAEVPKKTYRESLLSHREQIRMSQQLATIACDVPIHWDLAAMKAQGPDVEALRALYQELEFSSLQRELGPAAEAQGKDYGSITPEDAGAFLAALPAGTPIAVMVEGLNGELSTGVMGLSHEIGRGVSLPMADSDPVRNFFEDASRLKVTHDVKTLLLKLHERGLQSQGFSDDLMLAAFLLHADASSCTAGSLAEHHLQHRLGSGAEQQAECVLELWTRLSETLRERGMEPIYREIDMPLVDVLVAMERTGIRIETAQLAELSKSMDAEVQRLSTQIYELAGKTFNINSPQQLGKVLFEDLKLPVPVKYGKGKSISTAADVLEGLAEEHDIARLVLEYRQVTKLKGTYVDALPALIRPGTGRVHTTFNQIGAATGRLSSLNPNLQNIPIRSELGRQIRAAFVPEPGWTLIAADYSQIELRLLAHFSQDPVLVDAFSKGQDVHARTAAEVFGVMPEMVNPDMRRMAKTVNFGIIYGQTSFGLAKVLQIEVREAERFIRRYFETYTGVKRYIDEQIRLVRQTGVTRTLFGRERPIPDIHAKNPNARGFAERTAVNTPIQGTAADLIKMAMLRIHRGLSERRLQTRMLLQVHDELLFESPPHEVDVVKQFAKEEMERVYQLTVPLLVDVGAGPNWRDAK